MKNKSLTNIPNSTTTKLIQPVCITCIKPPHISCRDWRYVHKQNCPALSDILPFEDINHA